jgi:cation diffusion facilitator CzcD-associated flavoprotein CzcO
MATEHRRSTIDLESPALAVVVLVWTAVVFATGLSGHPYIATAIGAAGFAVLGLFA